jgi:hypothetical protein
MAIVERHNHFWASSYAAPGEDATIDYPNLDLRLRNITDYQMFMECAMEGQTLTVNIYGYQDPSYDNIKVYTENYDVVKGENYKTTTYRVLYLNHEIVNEETICHSTYSLTDGYSVKDPDSGSYRVTVYGETFSEAEPETEPETYDDEEETISEEETSVYDDSADYSDDSAEYSDEGYESADDYSGDEYSEYEYEEPEAYGVDLPEEYIE